MLNLPKDLYWLIKAKNAYYDYVMHLLVAPIWEDLSESEKAFWISKVKNKLEYTIK